MDTGAAEGQAFLIPRAAEGLSETRPRAPHQPCAWSPLTSAPRAEGRSPCPGLVVPGQGFKGCPPGPAITDPQTGSLAPRQNRTSSLPACRPGWPGGRAVGLTHLCAVVVMASMTSMMRCRAESVPMVMSVPQKSLSMEPTSPAMFRWE